MSSTPPKFPFTTSGVIFSDTQPRFTDAMFNFVPGSAFEIGSSMAILDNPGRAGEFIDEYAHLIAGIIREVYNTALGNETFSLDPTGQPITLRNYFNKKILEELSPHSDQIGRCLEPVSKDEWLGGRGKDWLISQLILPSNGSEYTYKNMLTKVRTISALGTIIREMMPNASNTAALILHKPVAELVARYNELRQKIRHERFDDIETRARSEKMPLIDGTPITKLAGISVSRIDAASVGLGFGQVWHPTGMKLSEAVEGAPPPDPEALSKATKQYTDAEQAAGGRQGMTRLGQDIVDMQRPGLLGASSDALVPPEMAARLRDDFSRHIFNHGSGLNRWRLTGGYAKGSWNQSMPAAGAHSGGTSDSFLALNCVGESSIFGNPHARGAGLIISSFMNFGGYHSFVETFPIAEAVADNQVFSVKVTAKQRELYHRMADQVRQICPAADPIVEGYYGDFRAIMLSIQAELHKIPKPPNELGKSDILILPKKADQSISSEVLTPHPMRRSASVGAAPMPDEATFIPAPMTEALATAGASLPDAASFLRALDRSGVWGPLRASMAASPAEYPSTTTCALREALQEARASGVYSEEESAARLDEHTDKPSKPG